MQSFLYKGCYIAFLDPSYSEDRHIDPFFLHGAEYPAIALQAKDRAMLLFRSGFSIRTAPDIIHLTPKAFDPFETVSGPTDDMVFAEEFASFLRCQVLFPQVDSVGFDLFYHFSSVVQDQSRPLLPGDLSCFTGDAVKTIVGGLFEAQLNPFSAPSAKALDLLEDRNASFLPGNGLKPAYTFWVHWERTFWKASKRSTAFSVPSFLKGSQRDPRAATPSKPNSPAS